MTGCDCRHRESDTAVLVAQGSAETDDSQRQKEVFDREIERLNALEDSPGILETPGGEKLVQAADRLNKWIRDRKPDELWKPDESFLDLESTVKETAEAARDAVRLLQVLRGEEGVTDKDGQPVKGSDTLEEERKQVVRQLELLEGNIQSFAQKTGLGNIGVFAENIGQLRKQFASLETIRNLNANAIRAFAKQKDAEVNQFIHLANSLEQYAAELRTDGMFLHVADVDYMKQGVWLKDISQWARGEKQQALERVKNLFDWTVCNVDLTRNRNNPFGLGAAVEVPLQYPWQTLLLGYGTVWDRAWIFIELLRQQRIDACLITTMVPSGGEGEPDVPMTWAVGVYLEGELYLFLPMYGLALPGPEGLCHAEDGSLEYKSVATFSQVLKDDRLLRQMDMSEDQKFPLTSQQLARSTALIVASPETASLRMKVIESELSGEQNMVLSTNTNEQRRVLDKLGYFQTIDIWKYPLRVKFEQILMSRVTSEMLAPFLTPNPKRVQGGLGYPLWTGRILYFKGRIPGQDSAMTAFQEARISDRDIMEFRSHAEFRNDPTREFWLRLITTDATYWLGLSSFEIDSTGSSKDFFLNLEKKSRKIWGGAVEYMLGRIAEQEKNYEEAVSRFRRAGNGPIAEGNRLRAKWLESMKKPPVE